jgi:hypothetical protein
MVFPEPRRAASCWSVPTMVGRSRIADGGRLGWPCTHSRPKDSPTFYAKVYGSPISDVDQRRGRPIAPAAIATVNR